jgi:transcription elongation factor Elf1
MYCNSCDFKSNSKDSFPIHTKDNHSVTFKCTKCDFDSEVETELQTHEMKAHTYKCGVCDFSMKDKEILEKYIISAYSKVDYFKRIFTLEYYEYENES